jgi:hypothetical protein
MSFDEDYPNRKDHRRQYYDHRAFDATYRSHGSCGCRKRTRDYKVARRMPMGDDDTMYEHGIRLIATKKAYELLRCKVQRDCVNWEMCLECQRNLAVNGDIDYFDDFSSYIDIERTLNNSGFLCLSK